MLRARRFRALLAGTAIAVGLVAGAPTAASAAGCDTTDPGGCMLPYPNNFFTKGSSVTPTKRLLNLPSAGMPVNKDGVKTDSTEWNRLDGFSPGSMLVTYVPGIDLVKSKITPVTAPQDYSKPDAGAVVIDTATGKRWPIYGELDLQAATPSNRSLILRPLVNFTEGNTYVVVLRNMKTASGRAIAPSSDFKKLRDKKATGTLAKRKAEFDGIFKVTGKAGISRSSIYRAWTFTVASRQSLTSRLLAIRDDAFAKLGDTNLADREIQGSSPTFTIDNHADEGLHPRSEPVPEPPRLRHDRRALLPEDDRAAGRIHPEPQPRHRPAGPEAGQHQQGPVRLQHPAQRRRGIDRQGEGLRLHLRPRPAWQLRGDHRQ